MAELRTLSGLNALIGRARRRIALPRWIGAFGSLLVLVGVFVIAALFGVFEMIPPKYAAIAVIVFALGVVYLGLRGWRRWKRTRPTREEAIRRLDATDEARPLYSLSDRPAHVTGEARELWRVHQAVLAERARKLKGPDTQAEWTSADPFLLRAVLPILLVVAAALAGPQALGRLQSALSPDYGALIGAENTSVDAWLTPPDYTAKPPIYLKADMERVQVPAGSMATVRVIAPARPVIRLKDEDGDSHKVKLAQEDDGAWQVVFPVTEATRMEVHVWGERAAWEFGVEPDAPPTAAFESEPEQTPQDKLDFTWSVADDYGVDALYLELVRPAEGERPEQTDRIEIVMNSLSPLEAKDKTLLDATRHKWAGLELTMRLVAIDGAGQEGKSEDWTGKLPDKLLLQPLAKAAQEVRLTVLREEEDYPDRGVVKDGLVQDQLNLEAVNRLDTAPPGVQRAVLMLDSLTVQPHLYFRDMGIYLGLRHARDLLNISVDMDEARETEPLLWAMAMRAEYGSVADALQALLTAKRALENALRNGASEAEIERLVEAFKQAAQNYIAAKIAEAMTGAPAPDMGGMDGEFGGEGGPNLGAGDLQDMLDALGDLADTGAKDQARQLLSDITNMLENLEFQRGGAGQDGDGFPMPGEQGESAEADVPENERMTRELLEQLSELLGDQRQLNDDTMRAGQRDPFSNPLPGEENADPDALADRQGELQERLEQLQRGMEQLAEEGEGEGQAPQYDPDAADAIQRAQRRAEQALERGDFQAARRFQDEATELMRDLAGDVAGELDRIRGEDDPDDSARETDPFGNPTGGRDDTNTIEIPKEADRQRAKDILDEIRRRFGTAKDGDERDYLERLLDRF